MTLIVLFWILLFIIIYTFVGYAIILWILVKFKNLFYPGKKQGFDLSYEPEVCLFVTAYNEVYYIKQKVANSFQVDYPKEKIQYVWVTDGSDDGTPEILKTYPELEVHHQSERRGKMHAMNRGMKFVKAPIVIFSDSNTLLNKNAIREIVKRFSNKKVGCVAGEKRIIENKSESAAGAGEGLYWRFESFIKKYDAELNSAVGAAGELFAVRTELFEDVEPDTLLDDFIISLRIALKGYKIDYAPEAYASETASVNMKEELKRKIRIAAGGVQSIVRLKQLFNVFKCGLLTWQYISHKVLRWTLTPLALFLIFFVNLGIVLDNNSWGSINFYALFFYFQSLCYLVALIGGYYANKKIKSKFLFAPYYFVMINYAAIRGIFRYLRGQQSVNWEKSKRA